MKDKQADSSIPYATKIQEKIDTLKQDSLTSKAWALQAHSDDMKFFKETYKNTPAASEYNKEWKKATGLNPVSATFLLGMAKHAQNITTALTLLMATASLALMIFITFAPLTFSAYLIASGVLILTGITTLAGQELLKGKYLTDIGTKISHSPCPTYKSSNPN